MGVFLCGLLVVISLCIPAEGYCRDIEDYRFCQKQAQSWGNLCNNPSMRENCKASSGLCFDKTDAGSGTCTDILGYDYCQQEVNSRFVDWKTRCQEANTQHYCKASCGLCTSNANSNAGMDDPCKDIWDHSYCQTEIRDWGLTSRCQDPRMQNYCKASCRLCYANSHIDDACRDKPGVACSSLKSQGRCRTDSFVINKCRRTCNFCYYNKRETSNDVTKKEHHSTGQTRTTTRKHNVLRDLVSQ